MLGPCCRKLENRTVKVEEKDFSEKDGTVAEREETKVEKKRFFYHEDGKTYYTRKTERRIFFALTMVMVLMAMLAKLGILG